MAPPGPALGPAPGASSQLITVLRPGWGFPMGTKLAQAVRGASLGRDPPTLRGCHAQAPSAPVTVQDPSLLHERAVSRGRPAGVVWGGRGAWGPRPPAW